jgi:hypothetical protein
MHLDISLMSLPAFNIPDAIAFGIVFDSKPIVGASIALHEQKMTKLEQTYRVSE